MRRSCQALSRSLINPELTRIPVSPTLHINEMVQSMKQEGKQIFHFGFGQSPFPVPDVMIKSLQQNSFQKEYLPTRGLPELRQTISTHLKREFGTDQFAPENIMIGPGSKQLLFQLFLLFNGDIMLPSPSWVSYYPQCLLANKNVKILKTSKHTNWHVTPEELERQCLAGSRDVPKMILLNSPCNPTGQCYTEEELKELVKIFRKYDIIVIADEIYGLLQFNGNQHSIASIYPEKTIIASGISKAFGAGGWRLGFVALPPALAEFQHAMDCIASETFSATSSPIQYASIEAFKENKELDMILKQKKSILAGVASYVHNSLSNIGVDVSEAKGGFYMFPDFENFRAKLAARGITNSQMMCKELLNDRGVAILPGSAFLKEENSLTARLAFVNFDGKCALSHCHETPNIPVSESFVRKYCPDTVTGIETLCQWFSNL